MSADQVIVQQAFVDPRPRRRRLLPPIGVGVGVLVALGYVRVVDPNTPGHYPLCPTRALLGIDCPGCGLMRGTHDLMCGNLAGALDHNLLIVFIVPLVIVLWIRWLGRAWTGNHPAVTSREFTKRNRIMVTCLVLMVAFGVVRNFVPYLGSGV